MGVNYPAEPQGPNCMEPAEIFRISSLLIHGTVSLVEMISWRALVALIYGESKEERISNFLISFYTIEPTICQTLPHTAGFLDISETTPKSKPSCF